MNQNDQIRTLELNGSTIIRMYQDVTQAESRWRPAEGKWSLLEILVHLCDEERDDFRTRLSSTLEDPDQDWPPIDPQAWVTERNYNSRDLKESLQIFGSERVQSLKLLGSLNRPSWTKVHHHPSLGPIRAGDLLASWAAHDLLHLRQIANTRLLYVSESVSPFSTAYAMP